MATTNDTTEPEEAIARAQGAAAGETPRDKVIVRTSIVGIVANVLLATFKAVVGLMPKGSNEMKVWSGEATTAADGKETVTDDLWKDSYKEHFRTTVLTDHLVIVPSWEEDAFDPHEGLRKIRDEQSMDFQNAYADYAARFTI